MFRHLFVRAHKRYTITLLLSKLLVFVWCEAMHLYIVWHSEMLLRMYCLTSSVIQLFDVDCLHTAHTHERIKTHSNDSALKWKFLSSSYNSHDPITVLRLAEKPPMERKKWQQIKEAYYVRNVCMFRVATFNYTHIFYYFSFVRSLFSFYICSAAPFGCVRVRYSSRLAGV